MSCTNAPTSQVDALVVCLHVTHAEAIPSITSHGLVPKIGPLSAKIEARPGIFLFPSWADLMSANWLFDEASWPHATEPALLAVDVRGVSLELEAGFEVVTRRPLEPWRVTVLSPGETGWNAAEQRFLAMGGRAQELSPQEIASWLREQGHKL